MPILIQKIPILQRLKRPYEFVKTKGNTNRPLKLVVKVLPACSSEGSGIGLFLLTHLKWSGCSKMTYSSNYPVTNRDRKSTRLNSSHVRISYAVFCLKKETYE